MDENITITAAKRCLLQIAANYEVYVSDFIRDVEEAETIPEIMDAKQKFMRWVVADLPLGPSECPYCLSCIDKDGNLDCSRCEYAARFGFCKDEKSRYRNVTSARDDLSRSVEEYWEPED